MSIFQHPRLDDSFHELPKRIGRQPNLTATAVAAVAALAIGAGGAKASSCSAAFAITFPIASTVFVAFVLCASESAFILGAGVCFSFGAALFFGAGFQLYQFLQYPVLLELLL